MSDIQMAWRSLRAHPLRALLTCLGIIIGIASILAIFATIQGMNAHLQQTIVGAGTNTVVIEQKGQTFSPMQAQKALNQPHVKAISAYRYSQNFTTDLMGGTVFGVNPDYFKLAGYRVVSGRPMEKNDQASQLVWVNTYAAQVLFGSRPAVGQVVWINKNAFKVAGVLGKEVKVPIRSKEDYDNLNQMDLGQLFVTKQSWYLLGKGQSALLMQADSVQNMKSAAQQVAKALGKRTFKPVDIWKQAQQLEQMGQSFHYLLVAVAAISLLVGGIGVMNIMLVSVNERTREIGLRKAVGARNRAILTQFLIEAIMLTGLGGLLGLLVGLGLAFGITSFLKLPLILNVGAILLACLFSMGLGLLFGFLPAYKASRLDPIIVLKGR